MIELQQVLITDKFYKKVNVFHCFDKLNNHCKEQISMFLISNKNIDSSYSEQQLYSHALYSMWIIYLN